MFLLGFIWANVPGLMGLWALINLPQNAYRAGSTYEYTGGGVPNCDGDVVYSCNDPNSDSTVVTMTIIYSLAAVPYFFLMFKPLLSQDGNYTRDQVGFLVNYLNFRKQNKIANIYCIVVKGLAFVGVILTFILAAEGELSTDALAIVSVAFTVFLGLGGMAPKVATDLPEAVLNDKYKLGVTDGFVEGIQDAVFRYAASHNSNEKPMNNLADGNTNP